MRFKKTIYLYPSKSSKNTEGGNPYITCLTKHLNKGYTIINKPTKIGISNAILNFRRYKIIYFNWIEDLPDRKFGVLQIPVLLTLLILCKLFNKKIIWFIHNNISHYPKNYIFKRCIIALMQKFSNIILSHSKEVRLDIPEGKFFTFDHPIENAKSIKASDWKFDLLIWGTVYPYKGILELMEFNAKSPILQSYSIVIAGKFSSEEYYKAVLHKSKKNVTIINKVLPEEELIDLFQKSRYILFTYNSSSILSSASLCKSLSYKKEIIGPYIGSFKELGERKLIYNYKSLETLETLLMDLQENKIERIDRDALDQYISETNWDHFYYFLDEILSKN